MGCGCDGDLRLNGDWYTRIAKGTRTIQINGAIWREVDVLTQMEKIIKGSSDLSLPIRMEVSQMFNQLYRKNE